MLIQEPWETDRESLLQLPEYPFPVFRYEALSVYGLFPTLAGKTVQAKIFFGHIEFYYSLKPRRLKAEVR